MASMPEAKICDNPLAIVGGEDTVLGFKALGLKSYSIKELKDVEAVLDEIIHKGCAICLVQDDIYQQAETQINIYRNLPLPIFIPFPKNIKTDLLENIVKNIRIRATGAI